MSIIPGTPKSTLTVRELDGTPSGSATELVLPNGSLSFSGSVATIDLVGNADSRLGVVYDPTNEDAALSCNNQLWTFLDGTTRDNLRTELQAAASSHPHGNITNSGTIGTTADLILGTGTAGAIETKTASDVRTILGLATTDSPTFAGLILTGNLSASSGFTLTTGTVGSGVFIVNNDGNSRWQFNAGEFLIAGTIRPTTNNARALGTSSNRWSNIFSTNVNVSESITIGASGILVGGTNLIEQRNGTNAQVARWAKTWTSLTNNEVFELDCAGNATTFDLAVCSGSAGGSNRGLRFGSKFAGGAFSPWLSFGTDGRIGVNQAADSAYRLAVSQSDTLLGLFTNTGTSFSSGGAGIIGMANDGAALASGDRLGFFLLGGSTGASTTNNSAGIQSFATENWSSVAAGARLDVVVQPNGTVGTGARVTAASFASNGISILAIADSSAANSTFYYSTTQNKLVWKDAGGTVNVLY